MKRLGFIVLCGLLLFALGGCSSSNKLTIEKVKELSTKGDELSWEDFEKYECTDVGSGLIVLKYSVNSDYYILIGGPGTEITPIYIYLVKEEDHNKYIDIRHEDIDSFLDGE